MIWDKRDAAWRGPAGDRHAVGTFACPGVVRAAHPTPAPSVRHGAELGA